MVSPSKKKKIENKGRAPDEPSSPGNSLGARRTKSCKPLSNKKFYLDIKNHTVLRQIETKLTTLGARLELFLVKDVNCVVTDKDDYPKNNSTRFHPGLVTPSPSPFSVSVSPVTTATDSPTDGVISKRTRSRAEAMLERVKQQPQRNTTINILDNAAAWKIPILSLPKFLAWLEKVERKGTKEPGVRELRGYYLKLETGVGRPDFRQFKVWPKISYSDKDPAAFLSPKPLSKHDPQRMTRKVNKLGKEGSTAPAPGGGNGYCEICRVHYDQLDSHISSSQHNKLVSDPSQYAQLDSLISQHELGNVTSVRKSLRIAKSPPVEMGGKQSLDTASPPPPNPPTPTMNGHVTRSRTDKILCNGLSSPIEKKKKEGKYSGSNDSPLTVTPKPETRLERGREREREKERELEKDKEREREKEKEREREKEKEREREKEKEREREKEKEREREKEKEREREKEKEREREKEKERDKDKRQRERDRLEKEKAKERIERLKEEQKLTDHNLRSRPSPIKVSGAQARKVRASRKRLSVEEKLIEDNKSYYKVEVLNSKLRSTDQFIAQRQAEARLNGDIGERNGCGEDQEGEREGPPESAPLVVRFKKVQRKSQLSVLSDEAENFMFRDLTRREEKAKAPETSSSEDSSNREDSDSSHDYKSSKRKKKKKKMRKSQLPNKNGPHLFSSPPRVSCRARLGSKELTSHDEEEHAEEEPCTVSLSELTFSFENPPKDEPWMEGYHRPETEFSLPRYSDYPLHVLPYEYTPAERMKLLSKKSEKDGLRDFEIIGSTMRRRGERLSRLLEDGRPRKSPRCHASTLAIMSSLMRRRPMRECAAANLEFTYEEESRSSLPETIESSSSNSMELASRATVAALESGALLPVDPSGDSYAIALARYACGETSQLQIAPGPCLPVDPAVFAEPPEIDISSPGLGIPLDQLLDQAQNPHPPFRLLDYDNRFNVDQDSASDTSDLLSFTDDGRGIHGRRKKRKRNLTGWPAGKPRRKVLKIKEELPELDMLPEESQYNIEQCVIKVEPLSPAMAVEFSFKDEPSIDDGSVNLPVIPIRKGRGRPRKYDITASPSSTTFSDISFSSPKSPPKKKGGHRSYAPRRSYLK